MARTVKTPENRAKVLKALKKWGRYASGAAAAGMTRETLRVWRKEDAAFSAACDRAREIWAQSMLAKIENHEKATAKDMCWVLERALPDQFGKDAASVQVEKTDTDGAKEVWTIAIPGVTDGDD